MGKHLVLDEGDEGRDDHRKPIADDCRQLVAQALACRHMYKLNAQAWLFPSALSSCMTTTACTALQQICELHVLLRRPADAAQQALTSAGGHHDKAVPP